MSKKGATLTTEVTPELDPSLVSGDAWANPKPAEIVATAIPASVNSVQQMLQEVTNQLGLSDKGLEWFSSDGFYILAKPVIKVPYKDARS
jgi:hypothetical protein